MFFYESELGQLVYSWRTKSVEPLIEQITTDERAGTLSENSFMFSSVFSILPSLRSLPPVSMTAYSEYFLWRSSLMKNMSAGYPCRLLRDLLTYD